MFNKVARGINITNLPSVAASAQLNSNKTSVLYSIQTYGLLSNDLTVFFKPEVNQNFDVTGFGMIQAKINGIHHILSDSLFASKVTFTPEKLGFREPKDLEY